MDSGGFWWVSVVFGRIRRVSVGFGRFHWVSVGFGGFCVSNIANICSLLAINFAEIHGLVIPGNRSPS